MERSNERGNKAGNKGWKESERMDKQTGRERETEVLFLSKAAGVQWSFELGPH